MINLWFAERYGSRKGALLTYWYRILSLFGWYRAFRKIDWGRVDRIVFVCKGNVCRSPYAEAVAKSLHIDALSCGIDTVNGKPANTRAISTALRNNIDLSSHMAQVINDLDIGRNDLVIAMEPWHIRYLRKNKCADCQYTLLGLWGKAGLPYIHDPYGLSQEYFNRCFDFIDRSVRNLVVGMRDKATS